MSDAQSSAGGSRALTHSPAQPAPSPVESAEHWQGRPFEEHDPAQAMAASWGLNAGADAGSPPLPPAGPPFRGHSFGNVSIYAGGPLPVQTQLTIGQPNDPYEQEADRVAAQVMKMADPPPPVQRQDSEEGEESHLQAQPLAQAITPLVQREGNDLPAVPNYQLNPPSLLAPADPAARYRLGGDHRLQIDPELQAAALRYVQQQISPVNLMPNLAQLQLGSTPSIPLIPSPGAAAGAAAPQPLVPAGEEPKTAREGTPGDVLRVAMAQPIINATLTQLRTRTEERILHDWQRLQLGEQVGAVSALGVISAGAIAGIISNAESRQWALGQLNGQVLPVPGLDWLRVEVNTSADALMMGFHLDVGALLPSFLGFGPGSSAAIGGPPQPQEFVPGVQRSPDPAQPTAPQPNLEPRLNASRSGGSPLPNEVRQFMEPRFGFDFSKVKVHNDADAVQMNRELGAQAFAHGNHIYYGAGKAPANDHLTGHELTHTLQQGAVQRFPNTLTSLHRQALPRKPQVVSQRTEQLPSVQMLRRVGTTNHDSVRILQELAAGDNTAAMRVVVRAIDDVLRELRASGTTVHVLCSGGGDQFDLSLSSEDAALMQQRLNTRIQSLSSAAESSSLPGGMTVSQDALTEHFNREFRQILPALRAAGKTPSGGGEETRSVDFTTLEIREMFSSAGQRQKMLHYCSTHEVPDRLFNGDDLGNANAHQRILISAHILTHGRIQAGSFTQQLHARFCGHWVQLVNNYAGAAPTGGRGMENSFDHTGHIVMGSGSPTGGYGQGKFEGDRVRIEDSEREAAGTQRQYRRTPLPITAFDSIQPGDWLYVFTNTNTRGGDHSIIFSHWLGDFRESGGINYRLAAVFSQTRVSRGGALDRWLLGDQAGHVAQGRVYPITRVSRHASDDRSPGTVAEVERADLGLSPGRSSGISRQNEQFIRRHTPRGQRISLSGLNRFLQETNLGLLDQLENTDRLEPGQLMLWQATNQSAQLEVLVRLNERLNNLLRSAAALQRGEAAEAARVDPRREAAQAEAEANRERLEADLEKLDGDIDRLGRARAIDHDAVPLRQRRRELSRQRQRITSRISRSRGIQRAELIEQRTSIDEQRANLLIQIEAIEARRDQAIQSARETTGVWRVGGSSAHSHYNRLVQRRERLHGEIQALEEAGGFRMAHPGREFRSTETMRRLTGLLQNVDPQPAWRDLVEPSP